MTYRPLPADLPRRLRAAGLKVEIVGDWHDNGRPRSAGGFNPVGVNNHHIGAHTVGWSHSRCQSYARWLFYGEARNGLSKPLCNLAICIHGTVFVGAGGRANHAGKAKATGSVAAGDGNMLYIGIEWMLSGTQLIPRDVMQAGVTTNAVLSQMLGTSVQALTCHYATSVTGKWDIGDPNGINFKGAKVLDLGGFRAAVGRTKALLYGRKPPKAARKVVRVTVGHASMQFSDSRAQKKRDALKLMSLGLDWLTGTEAGETPLRIELRNAAAKYGYYIHFWRGNWVAVKKSIVKAGSLQKGGRKVVDASQTVGPGHDRGLCFITFIDKRGIGKITVTAGHYQTKGSWVAKDPARRVNIPTNRKMAEAIAKLAREKGGGAALFWYHGDQNIDDEIADTFAGGPVTSCWDELRKWPNTGKETIDVIATYDRDARVRCLAARAHADEDLYLYTDHKLITATYAVAV